MSRTLPRTFRISRLVQTISLCLLFGVVEGVHAQPLEHDTPIEDIRLITTADRIITSYVIALDRIGIVPEESQDYKRLLPQSEEFRGEIVKEYDSGMLIVQLTGNRFEQSSREKLNELAKELRSKKNIREAGMVLYPKGGATPMLVTDQLVVGFREVQGRQFAEDFARDFGLKAVMRNPLLKQHWLFRVNEGTKSDVLEIVQALADERSVDFAVPNFTINLVARQHTPNDPLFGEQWHHVNSGQAGGTYDADNDSDLAWDFTTGDEDIVVAIIDGGFDISHEDIQPNLWINPVNDDNQPDNLCMNDVHGCNFSFCTYQPDCGIGDITATLTTSSGAVRSVGDHGTAVAGVVAGRGDNSTGIVGVCPMCSLMLIQQIAVSNNFANALAISYAGLMGADILSNSWGYGGASIPIPLSQAIDSTAAMGTAIFWATDNSNIEECAQPTPDFSSNPNVIAVAAASNQDRKVTESAYGDCLDLLGTSYGGYGPSPNPSPDPSDPPFQGQPYTGTLNMVTTDRPGADGYNNTKIPNARPGVDPTFCPTDVNAADISSGHDNYTRCFGGTSAATPVAAGVAGLVLSVDGALSRTQIQRLLQDTADKIEPSGANHYLSNGMGMLGASSTHGYGRVNALEAVRVAAPKTGNVPGLGGTDIYIRDNALDWGNTAQQVAGGPAWRGGSNVLMESTRGVVPHYQSVDIKIDAPDASGNYRPPPTPMTFDAYPHENPISGELNKVYVRVHNRGPNPASNVLIKLHWVWAGPALPQLPTTFWSDWPADPGSPGAWHSLGSHTVASVGYSGASVAGTAADGSEIVSFDFTGPPLDPQLPAFRHHCLFAVIDSPDDPVSVDHLDPAHRLVPDIVTPKTNNVTHLNVSVQDPATSGSGNGLMIRNPFPEDTKFRLTTIQPKGWEVSLSEFDGERTFVLPSGKEVPVIVKIRPDGEAASGQVEIRQEVLTGDEYQPLGGFIFQYRGKE